MAKKGGEKAEKGEGIIVKRNYKNSYQNRPARVQVRFAIGNGTVDIIDIHHPLISSLLLLRTIDLLGCLTLLD